MTNPDTAVTFDPATMNRSTVVPARFHAGTSTPLDVQMPYWEIPAYIELMQGRGDPTRALAARGFFDGEYRGEPARLMDAAMLIVEAARKCRDARWQGLAPAPLDDRMYFGCTTHEGAPAWRHGIGSHLVDANSTAMLACETTARWLSLEGDAILARLQALLVLAWRYPNVSSAREADLAASGFTAAELLITSAARRTREVADLYRGAAGTRKAEMAQIATDAAMLARGAQKTIEEGVRHTLARHLDAA